MIKVGDSVLVGVLVTNWGRRALRKVRNVQADTRKGRVVWVGEKFVCVEFAAGYRECFDYNEVQPARRAAG